MNYTIVQDEHELERFIRFLPDLTKDEKFYVALLARKKYTDDPRFKADKAQLKRFVTTKERLYSDLKKLEVAEGLYQFDDITITQNMLAVYINPNPRSLSRSYLKMMKEGTEKLYQGLQLGNPKSESLSALQTTPSKRIYFDVDIDLVEGRTLDYKSLLSFLEDRDVINFDAIDGNIVKTRGGYHILVELDRISKEYKNKWFMRMRELPATIMNSPFKVMMNSDNIMPLPGCVQGGTVPKMMSTKLSACQMYDYE